MATFGAQGIRRGVRGTNVNARCAVISKATGGRRNENRLDKLHTGDNPIYVRMIQEDGHLAWTSPVYLVRHARVIDDHNLQVPLAGDVSVLLKLATLFEIASIQPYYAS